MLGGAVALRRRQRPPAGARYGALDEVDVGLRARSFVTPDDVKAIAPDVLRHRVLRTYEAEAEEVTSDEIVSRILEAIPAP